MSAIFCPKCGEWAESQEVSIEPGVEAWTCPNCEARWRFDFYEVGEASSAMLEEER